ncbi:unnamed protein product [Orchesella dallaii]|uniref:AAA+ ATPase domain-containing protein n=1 Tax=Orchesella dallaii TaxID=48710 RepID=A0ABP1PLY1_9HEXA
MKSSRPPSSPKVKSDIDMGNRQICGISPEEGAGKEEDDAKSTGSCSTNSNNTKSNNLTVVVLSGITPNLVCHADGVDGGVPAYFQRRNGGIDIGNNGLFSGWKPNEGGGGSGGGGGGDPNGNKGFPNNLPILPGGGGGGGGPRPENVPESFRLEALGGLDDQISYLRRSVLLPMLRPEVLKEWGIRPPKGILLYGPPGTGKTFLAKALVNELKDNGQRVNFFYRKGGDVFSMWFGESARKLREVFDAAKSMAPSIIFFDEIDGLCPSRSGTNHGTEAYNAVVTCFLGQMDSLQTDKVYVIAATNRMEAVDPAVRRPGRFDKHLGFGFPDQEARERIIKIQTNKWDRNDRPSEDLIKNLAIKSIGYSGADLEKLCKDVVYVAIDENGGLITDSMKITENHWMRAMGSMQRTASNSFGSAQITPTKPTDTVFSLIEPVVTSVIRKIRPFLLSKEGSSDSPSFRKSMILSSVSKLQSKSFLNNQIIQGVLCDHIFNKMTIFELGEEMIYNKIINGKPTTVSVFYDVINQVRDSISPAVLFIPNLNEIMSMAKNSNVEEQLLTALGKVRGSNVFLLATSSLPLEEIQKNNQSWIKLFRGVDHCVQVGNPRKLQLSTFFNRIWTGNEIGLEPLLRDQIAKAVEVTDNDNFEDVLVLYGTLQGLVLEYVRGGERGEQRGDLKQLQGQMDEAINQYSQSKFRL